MPSLPDPWLCASDTLPEVETTYWIQFCCGCKCGPVQATWNDETSQWSLASGLTIPWYEAIRYKPA